MNGSLVFPQQRQGLNTQWMYLPVVGLYVGSEALYQPKILALTFIKMAPSRLNCLFLYIIYVSALTLLGQWHSTRNSTKQEHLICLQSHQESGSFSSSWRHLVTCPCPESTESLWNHCVVPLWPRQTFGEDLPILVGSGFANWQQMWKVFVPLYKASLYNPCLYLLSFHLLQNA